MKPYFDSGVITKWYLPEVDSSRALRLARRYKPPFMFTHLHRLELTTAWQLKVFRKELSGETVEQAMEHLRSDSDSGFWVTPAHDLIEIYERAERLAGQYAAAAGTRTLDVLHVAGAQALGASELVTGDRRQATLAAAAGLKVVRLHR